MNEQKINELWSHLHWLTVLAQTRPEDSRLRNPFLPLALMVISGALAWLIWIGGERLERARLQR